MKYFTVLLLIAFFACAQATQLVTYYYTGKECVSGKRKAGNQTMGICQALPGGTQSAKTSCPTSKAYNCLNMVYYTTDTCDTLSNMVRPVTLDTCDPMGSMGYFRFNSANKKFEYGCDAGCAVCSQSATFTGAYGTCWTLTIFTEVMHFKASLTTCARVKTDFWTNSASCAGSPAGSAAREIIDMCEEGKMYVCETDSGTTITTTSGASSLYSAGTAAVLMVLFAVTTLF